MTTTDATLDPGLPDAQFLARPPRTQEEHLAMLQNHPALSGTLILPTPPLIRAADEIVLRVATRQPCAAFCGPPRWGKSATRDYVIAELSAHDTSLLVLPHLCVEIGTDAASKFYNHAFAQAGGSTDDFGRDSVRALYRVVNRISTAAAKRKATHVVFMIDEIQRLSVAGLTYFASITNMLVEKGLQVTNVSFGSLEMRSMLDDLQLCGRQDLIGRFYAGMREFTGLTSEEELQEVLAVYDDPQLRDYPSGSGWALSQYFWPAAFAAGFRLGVWAAERWGLRRRVSKLRTAGHAVAGLSPGAGLRPPPPPLCPAPAHPAVLSGTVGARPQPIKRRTSSPCAAGSAPGTPASTPLARGAARAG